MRSAAFLAVAAALAFPLAAYAQFETGSVLGTTRDSTGAVLPGVSVTLRNVDTGIAATKAAREDGQYEFFTVRPGRYEVSAELQGFTTARATGIKVSIGERQRIDMTLSPGAVTESVDVVAGTDLET